MESRPNIFKFLTEEPSLSFWLRGFSKAHATNYRHAWKRSRCFVWTGRCEHSSNSMSWLWSNHWLATASFRHIPCRKDLLTSYRGLFVTKCTLCGRILSKEGHVPPVVRLWVEISENSGQWTARHISCQSWLDGLKLLAGLVLFCAYVDRVTYPRIPSWVNCTSRVVIRMSSP